MPEALTEYASPRSERSKQSLEMAVEMVAATTEVVSRTEMDRGGNLASRDDRVEASAVTSG